MQHQKVDVNDPMTLFLPSLSAAKIQHRKK
jgi:hypothetical protein